MFYPLLYLFWIGWNKYNSKFPFPLVKATRRLEEDDKVVICFHDWLGYPGGRKKRLTEKLSFDCGRSRVIRELAACENKMPSEVIVSLSGNGELEFDERMAQKIIRSSNLGLDFGGYNAMLQEVRKMDGNPFVILMNSSLAGGFYDGWLDDYCGILKDDRTIGLLGISTRARYPGLLRNHYVPHLQSFFLLSTKEVLEFILDRNRGVLPGAREKNKYRLIQKGEIGISKQILREGYGLAVVYKGVIYKFRLKNRFGNLIDEWPFPVGDIRYSDSDSESINSLSKLGCRGKKS
ncbi:MAG: hypothetical protein ACFFCW_41370 [Candidatus Hodarchaeota archaeon]